MEADDRMLAELAREREDEARYQAEPKSPATGRTPRPHAASPPMSAAPFESKADPHNQTAMRILEMARTLGIDPSEYHLLSIAMHALESPQEWQRVSEDSETYEKTRTDIAFFQSLVQTERERFRKTPSDNNPWVKIRDSATSSSTPEPTHATPSPLPGAASAASSSATTGQSSRSFYNFKTFRSSTTLPPVKKEAPPPARLDRLDLDVMRFTSSFTENGRKQLLKIHYLMSSEEFEVTLVQQPPAESKVYRVKSLKTKHGPASCWDLCIKATLDIFGRPTSLLQCDSDTRLWIETNAQRLLKVRSMLEQKLSKYEKITEKKGLNVPLCEYHLRSLMKDVANLKNRLAVHRPGLAERYAL